MDRIEALRLFTRLAERRSFSRAAGDLKIKQSTASKWIAQLEAELGARLVERTTRSLHLTEEGQRFLARGAEIVAAYDSAARELKERSPEPSGRLRLSAPAVFGRMFVVPPLIDFLRAYPKVEVEVVFSDRYVSLVEEGFDAAVRVGVPSDTSARGRKLADGKRLVVAAPAYLARRGRPKKPADLRGHDCLVHGDVASSTVWRFARGRGASVPVAVRGRVAANNSEAVLEMARSGLGIALLAEWLVEADVKKGALVTLLSDVEAPPAPISVLTPAGRYPAAAVRCLVDHLAAALAPRLSLGGSRTRARRPRV
jgi:DNA-binding transcriptional LysR family regulator